MSLNRYAKSRDVVEPEIVEALEAVGCHVERLDQPVDLLVGFRGRTVLMEVKTGKKKLTPFQKDFFRAWRGGELVTVRSVDEALAVVGGI